MTAWDFEKRVRMLEYILDNMKATVYAKSTDGRFVFVNKPWEELTGHPHGFVIGKSDAELNPDSQDNYYWTIDRKVIEGKQVVSAEEHITTEKGPVVLLSIKVPLSQVGEDVGLCGIGIDITSMKEMEKELLKAKEAAEDALVILREKNEELIQLNMALEEERRKSEKLLLNILPKSVADELKLTGRTETMSYDNVAVLFSDIVEFTNISATMNPKILINELNTIFTEFDNISEANNCERIKTIGDAYLAVCGIPDANDHFADNMVNTAVKIVQYLKKLQVEVDSPWRTKIGIHGGSVVGGVVGIKKYIYDIFGNTVNMASRIQSATKIYHVDILISDLIYSNLHDKSLFCIREIDTVRVKGDVTPIILYEVFDGDCEDLRNKKLSTLPLFENALSAYKTGHFQEANTLFQECSAICPEDELPQIYIRRCSTMIRIPPGPDWAGISGI